MVGANYRAMIIFLFIFYHSLALLWKVLQIGAILDDNFISHFKDNNMKSRKSLEIQIKSQANVTALAQKFPSINFTSTSRALMSLSRRDRFDEQKIEQMSAQISKQLQSKRSELQLLRVTHSTEASLKKFRYNQKQQTKVGKTLHFMKKFEKEKVIPTPNGSSLTKLPKHNAKRDQRSQSPSKMPIKQQNNSVYSGQVKFCNKKFGYVDGYAISSHVGSLCNHNNTRICVATNYLHSSNKVKEVSFFGIFEGRNGSNRAQYMRQYFHNTLINDELFYYNFDKAVSRTFEKIQRDFTYDPRYEGDFSVASSVICVIVGTKMYIIRYGAPNATISMKLGSYIKSFTTAQQKQSWAKQKKSYSSLSHYNSKILSPKQSLHIRMMELNPEYDFIILGNEGLYQLANSKNELGHTLWLNMLDQSPLANPSKLAGANKLAKVCNRICEQAVKKDHLGRCMSMIVIQFENMGLCFREPSELQLPHVAKNHEMTEGGLGKDQAWSMERQIMGNQTVYKSKNIWSDESKHEMSPRYLRTFSNLC